MRHRLAMTLAIGTLLATAPSQAQSGTQAKSGKEQSFSEKTYDRTVAVVAKHLKIKASQIKPTSNYIKDLGCDSLDCVEIVMALEEEFSIDIPDAEAEKLNTVQATAKCVTTILDKKASGKKKKEKD